MSKDLVILEVKVILTTAFLRGTPVKYAALARQFGLPTNTPAALMRSIRQAGGWYTPLSVGTCLHCGEPILIPKAKGRHKRTIHPACRPARDRAKSNAWERTKRQTDPLHAQLIRDRNREWSREEWPTLPEDQKRASMDQLHRATVRDQATTLELAELRFDRWSSDEDDYLLTHRTQSYRETALVLGRTMYAVHGRLKRLRKKGVQVPPGLPHPITRSTGQSKSATTHQTQEADHATQARQLGLLGDLFTGPVTPLTLALPHPVVVPIVVPSPN